MSWFSKAANVAKAAAKMAEQTAKQASDAASQAYNDMQQPPTTVTCSGCEATLGVPQEIFTWLCQTPQCLSSGVTYPLSVKSCNICHQPQPQLPPPEVACGVCQAHTLVPLTKAAQQMAEAKKAAQGLAATTAQAVSQTYNSLRSAPSQVPCVQCRAMLPVPNNIFDWTCTACNVTMTSPDMKEGETRRQLPAKACTSCNAAAPNTAPSVICANCNVPTPVPRSTAQVHLGQGVKATKQAAAATSAYVGAQYAKMSAQPTEFNCEHCNNVLRVEGVNPDEVKGDVMLSCGACNRATSVPKSNFVNAIRATVASSHRSATKAYYQVSKKPTVVCPTCNFHISVPVIADEKAPLMAEDEDAPKRDLIECPKCHTQIQPMAQMASSTPQSSSDAPPAYDQIPL